MYPVNNMTGLKPESASRPKRKEASHPGFSQDFLAV